MLSVQYWPLKPYRCPVSCHRWDNSIPGWTTRYQIRKIPFTTIHSLMLPKLFNNNNNNNCILPGLICPTDLWRPGTAQDLPTHWPGTRVWTQVCGWNASYAGGGRNFHGPQRDTAWLFLTMFIALTGFPHGVFPLWHDVRDSPTAPRLMASC